MLGDTRNGYRHQLVITNVYVTRWFGGDNITSVWQRLLR